MRILILFFAVLLIGFLFLLGSQREINSDKPVFLRTDDIANGHKTDIRVQVHSLYRPTDEQVKILQTDYSNLWAHLNHLYATNDVEAGKEFYTEGWFKQICTGYKKTQVPVIVRTDEKHELHIQNWASDGLVCTAIDSNVVLKYLYPDKSEIKTTAQIAVVLLLQGDHWRIDALRIINEQKINN